ncbi:MAG: PilZ domain-containing protein [Candidatus Acidiferrales bacterium]
MRTPESKKVAQENSSSLPVQEAERRTQDRQMFTVTAEVVEFFTGARFSSRTMDLGPGGCFIDTTNPLPVTTKVQLKLTKGQTTLQTGGTVVYSQNGLGMGIAFSNLEPEQQKALDSWLSGMAADRPIAAKPSEETLRSSPNQLADGRAIKRLLRLLVMKGIFTEAEASSVLIDPFV